MNPNNKKNDIEISTPLDSDLSNRSSSNLLTNTDIAKYSRQLIMPEISVEGQLKLKSAKVLVVGAGGLGCPALQYIVAAGVCTVGVVDYDVVEISNLHRQVLHTECNIGDLKTKSAQNELIKMNHEVNVHRHDVVLNSKTALQIISNYDIVLDCTDNVASRYLLNDACYLSGKPLVSGSALKFEGQLTVYNYNPGPCYRCIFPIPPPPNTVTNCSDAGVLGAITGIIGSLQALEAIKIIVGFGEVLSGRLLLFDGLSTTFKNVKLRNKRENCILCSKNATLKELVDYDQFCGTIPTGEDTNINILDEKLDRITVEKYKNMCDESEPHLLIDVRNPLEHRICKLQKSTNIPLKQILEDKRLVDIENLIKMENTQTVVCLCRRGNDSQLAVKHLKEKLRHCQIMDIIGGLHAWHNKIDAKFPIY